MFLAAMSTDNAFNSLKIFLFSSAFSTNGAIVIKPLTLKCGSFATSRTSFSTSSVLRPNFDSSHATLTSIRISETRFFFSLSFSIASAFVCASRIIASALLLAASCVSVDVFSARTRAFCKVVSICL